VLVCGAVGGCEADLREGVLEAVGFGGLGVAHVGGKVPACSLGYLGDDEAA
jgi:hypothetical protein